MAPLRREPNSALKLSVSRRFAAVGTTLATGQLTNAIRTALNDLHPIPSIIRRNDAAGKISWHTVHQFGPVRMVRPPAMLPTNLPVLDAMKRGLPVFCAVRWW